MFSPKVKRGEAKCRSHSKHFFCLLFFGGVLNIICFWGYWTTKAQLHIYDRSSAPTWRIKVKSIYLMLKFLWFFSSPLCALLLVSICFCSIISFGVSCLVLALCILHGLSISLVPALSSTFNSYTFFLLPLLLPLLSCLSGASLWALLSLFLPSEWTEPAWLPCILSACLSHSTVPAS